MPSNRGQKKKVSAASGDGGDAGDSKWKAAEVNMELLKEFEGEGGLFIEEAADEVGVTYGFDASTFFKASNKKAPPKSKRTALDDAEVDHPTTKKRRKAKAKAKMQSHAKASDAHGEEDAAPEDLEAENVRLRKELAELRANTPASGGEPEAEEPVLPHWVGFDLHSSLMKNIARLGFQKPTEVQSRCLDPAIRQRKDLVGAAETGSGKTLAFGLPILHHTLSSLDASSSSTATPSSGTETGPERKLTALAILPTRELAVQVRKHLNDVSEGTPVRAECIVGGMSILKQQRLLSRRPQIVVGTPGRVFAMLGLNKESENERHDWLRNSLSGLRHLVLDEADRLVEDGHFRELDRILELVYKSLARPQQLQTFVFSATLTLNTLSFKKGQRKAVEGNKVDKLSERLHFREPRAVHIVDLNGPGPGEGAGSGQPSKTSSQDAVDPERATKGLLLPEQLQFKEVVCSEDKDKEAMLTLWLLRRYRWEVQKDSFSAHTSSPAEISSAGAMAGGRIVIFLNAISSVLRLTPLIALLLESPSADSVLAKVKMSQNKQGREHIGPTVHVYGLHSRMRQKDRLKKMERFRSSQHGVLVCTDVAARGLDVKDIVSVLHFQSPRNAETFVHRSGRTARAGRQGESIALLGPGDHAQWQRLYQTVGIEKERVTSIGSTSFELQVAREASRLVSDLEKKVHRLSKQIGDRSWLKKAADEAELVFEESDEDADKGKSAAPRRELWGLWQQLQARVRRAPKRLGGGPVGVRRKR